MEYRHEDRDTLERIRPIEQPVFSAKYKAEELSQAVVRLEFKKEEPHTDLKIKLFGSDEYINIHNEDVRINSVYAATPKEISAENDYGVILLPKNIKPPGDFGFSLLLGVADRLDCELSVTGYPATKNAGIVTISGQVVNPIIRKNQLEYIIETEAGLSGSPVWAGYKGHPTVVAIHNYGRKINKPGYGSKGTRVNLKSLRDIFEWTGLDTTEKYLRASDLKEPVETPLRLGYSADDDAFRIIVDEIDDPPDTMLMSTFPVYAAPSRAAIPHPAFGFLQKDRWVSWDVPSAASLVNDLRRARLGRIDITPNAEGWEYQEGRQFAIVVPSQPGTTMKDDSVSNSLALVLEHTKVASWQLEEPGEVLDAIGYRKYRKGQSFKDAYHRWVLESPILE
ncbi:hypothetical protein DBV05_g11233 [Lasiodiplodia theobromae]|uniref:Serine protease n=1 Tax=Lasiodiplodia theobromae TaxID=45133 RepID=A0A5N5CXK2_9PEZI|nr:hypothetical protein DBV05_g11233 [Lasiodiplodia theobromae]